MGENSSVLAEIAGAGFGFSEDTQEDFLLD
jgi:hypothetical protein